MRIGGDGTWFYRGSPITRKPLVRLFSTVLQRDDRGAYWLVTPAEKGRIIVDDAPFVAVELTTSGSGRERTLMLRTNVDDIVTIDADHPLFVRPRRESGELAPYVLVRDHLEALISRPLYYDLVSMAVEEKIDGNHLFGVWSGGSFFPLGTLEDIDR